MNTLKQGTYQSPKAQVVIFHDDVIRTSDGSSTGEGLMYWSEGWGGIEIGGNS